MSVVKGWVGRKDFGVQLLHGSVKEGVLVNVRHHLAAEMHNAAGVTVVAVPGCAGAADGSRLTGAGVRGVQQVRFRVSSVCYSCVPIVINCGVHSLRGPGASAASSGRGNASSIWYRPDSRVRLGW
jgi:hypothetical protein